MSDTFTTKAKLQSGTIQGWLVLIIPFLVTLLRTFGVEIEDSPDTIIDNVMKVVEGVLYLIGLIKVYTGRKRATTPLRGGLFSGWRH